MLGKNTNYNEIKAIYLFLGTHGNEIKQIYMIDELLISGAVIRQ